MSREEEFTHKGLVYANNIYMKRKCELFEVKDIVHDFVQGAIYADQHPRKGLWNSEKVIDWLNSWFTDDICKCCLPITKDARKHFFDDLRKEMED